MILRCVECGKQYELGPHDNPERFQCECGGNIRKTLADFKIENDNKPIKTNKKHYKKRISKSQIHSVEYQKNDLFNRGYTLIHEDNEMYVFQKNKRVLPAWAIIILTFLFLPFILLILYKKPVNVMVKKEIKDIPHNETVLVS